MMSRKKLNVVRVAALATLVFACPRSGKNSFLVEDFAGKNLLPVVVQFIAVPCDGPLADSLQSSTHMVGNSIYERRNFEVI